MQEIKEKIEALKKENSYVSNIYSSLIEKLQDIKNSVANNLYAGDLDVATQLEIVRRYNKQVEFDLSVGLNSEFDVDNYLIKLDENKVVNNLLNNDFDKKDIFINYIITSGKENLLGNYEKYFAPVKFSAYCLKNFNSKKMYSIDYINKLINNGEIVVFSNLTEDKNNIVKIKDDEKETVLNNLDKLNLDYLDKDKLEIISNYHLKEVKNKLYKNHNLEKFFSYLRKYNVADAKDYFDKTLKEINLDYEDFNSVIYTSLIYQITNKISFLQKEKEEINSKYNQRIIQLMLNAKKEAKHIMEQNLEK